MACLLDSDEIPNLVFVGSIPTHAARPVGGILAGNMSIGQKVVEDALLLKYNRWTSWACQVSTFNWPYFIQVVSVINTLKGDNPNCRRVNRQSFLHCKGFHPSSSSLGDAGFHSDIL